MKKLLFLSLSAVALLLPATASAFTAQQFVNKGKVWMSTGASLNMTGTADFTYFQKGDITLNTHNNSGTTYVKVTDFINTNLMPEAKDSYMYLNINGNTATPAINIFPKGNGIYIQLSAFQNSYGAITPICVEPQNTYVIGESGNYVFILLPTNGASTTSNRLTSTFSGTCSTTSDGNYKITFGNYVVIKCHRTYGSFYLNNFAPTNYTTKTTAYYYALDGNYSAGGLTLQTYVPNATVTDTNYNYNGTSKTGKTARSYSANVTFDGNLFSIENWNNIGHPYDVNLTTYRSTLQDFQGTFNSNDLTVSLNGRDIRGHYTVVENIYTGNTYVPYYVRMGKTFSTSNGTVTDIPGKISGTVAHQGPHTWLEASNAKTVLNNVSINFDDYVIAAYNSSKSPKYIYQNYVETPVIKLNDALEYTHNLSLSKIYGYNAQTGDIYLNVDLTDFKNSAYVKEYQLYIVPGKFTMPNYSDADFSDKANGHVKGVRIDEFTSDYVPAELSGARNVAATGDKAHFNLLFNESDLKGNSNKGVYSIYVKAIYTDDSGLAPSFHALTPLDEITTGVTNLVVDTDVPAIFFNMNGVQVDGENMAPGVYIKKQGNKTSKVVIR